MDSRKQAFLREYGKEHSGVPKRGWCKLVELPKNPMVVGGKNFMRAEGIPIDEGRRFKPEACESSNGCWKQVKVGVRVKIRVRLGFDLVSWTVVQGGEARWLMGSWHHHRFKGKVEICCKLP
ncbi:unnamed protein product [Trifolium pratense]|uniref:Uncharacterized protein n=1 Tax=Trifolium pratense TaxID=57577 RepID=A0ACB0KRK7_TRIPR|nr:unnamed protein product [Trifolium pratense]